MPAPVKSVRERPPLTYPVTNKYVCGVKGTYRKGRVVGGADGAPGEWCWQVRKTNDRTGLTYHIIRFVKKSNIGTIIKDIQL